MKVLEPLLLGSGRADVSLELAAVVVAAALLVAASVVDHDAFQSTLAPVPGVVDRRGELLAARAAELDAVASQRPRAGKVQERSKRLIGRIEDFFKLV